MSVIAVTERREESTATVDQGGQTSYTRVFHVKTDDLNDGPGIAIGSIPVQIYDAYISGNDALDVNARAVSANARSVGDGLLWEVTVAYEWLEYDYTNPLTKPTEVNWGFVEREVTVDRDFNNQVIVNSAYDFYDPGLTRVVSNPVLVATRNEATFSIGVAAAVKDKVNSTTFLSAPAKTCLCRSVTSTKQFNQGLAYWTVTYEFEFLTDGTTWQPEVLDAGYRKLNDAQDDREHIYISGEKPETPVPLDGSGDVLATNGTPVFTEYAIYGLVDFNGLGL